jgi:hypothetical protein
MVSLMQRAQLVGNWRNSNTGCLFRLKADGTATVVTNTQQGVAEETGAWEYVDAHCWKLRIFIPPQPDQPGLETGAWDVTEYKVISMSDSKMECVEFDDEGYHIVFERARS